jgi:hypothetical protein
VVRISPVPNSELNDSTPRTATAITAYSRLSRPGSSGSTGARPGARAGGAAAKAVATRMLNAMGVTTATASVQ